MGYQVGGELEVIYTLDCVGGALPVLFYAEGVYMSQVGQFWRVSRRMDVGHTDDDVLLSLRIHVVLRVVVLLIWSAVVSVIVDDHRPLFSQVVVVRVWDIHGVGACSASRNDLMVVWVVVIADLMCCTASITARLMWHCCGGGHRGQPCC